jgi:predicted extracellular nuclease
MSALTTRARVAGAVVALWPVLAAGQIPCATTHLIHAVQGDATTQLASGTRRDASPLAGAVVTIEGVVVGDYQAAGELRGVFVQEEDTDTDGNAQTSEGIFVFTGNSPVLDVQEGDRICVRGTVSEFFGMTQITATAAGSIVLTEAGVALPSAAQITLPVVGDLDAFYERFEGMRVRFTNPLYVAEYFELARYGQVVLAAGGRPFQYSHVDDTPTAAEYAVFRDALARHRVILDDTNNVQNAPLSGSGGRFFHPQPGGFAVGVQGTDFFRGGDVVRELTGVLHWSFAGQTGTDAWRIRPTRATPVVFDPVRPRPAAPPVRTAGIRVVGFNVLNYFTTVDTTSSNASGACGPSGTLDCRGADSVAEFERQSAKLVAALAALDADVFGLTELENNGAAATPAIAELARRLNATLGEERYAYVSTGSVGTDAITVGLLYRRDTLFPTLPVAVLDTPAFTDPGGTGQQRNRPAVAQTFEVIGATRPDRGAVFTVVVNHLKSKGADGALGAEADQQDGQGAWNETRTRAARYLVQTWIPAHVAASGDPDVLIVGDLNAYRGEDPIRALKAAGYIDLHEAFQGIDTYSYVFDGQLGYLDHALANAHLEPQVTWAGTWAINADEVSVFDYNDTVRDAGEASFEAKPGANPLYEANAFRTSDHDPVIVDLDLAAPSRCDIDRDGTVSHEDFKAILRGRDEPALGPTDARDLDGSGTIDVDDIRAFARECARTLGR